jgi:AmmeMemoRadiSam system protein B
MTPLGSVKIENFESISIKTVPQAHIKEHSLEVQVPFLQSVLPDFTLCPIALGQFAEISGDIIKAMDDHTLLVISSDLSHYLPYAQALKTDKATVSKILALSDVDHDEACGADGINILLRIAKQLKWKPVLLDYKNSGDTAGTKDQVVGYCSIAFFGDI